MTFCLQVMHVFVGEVIATHEKRMMIQERRMGQWVDGGIAEK